MRTRFSPILICGAATLFAACEGESTTPVSDVSSDDVGSDDDAEDDTVDGSSDGSDGGLDDTSTTDDVLDDDVYVDDDIQALEDVPVVDDEVQGPTDIESPDVDQDDTTDIESPDVDPVDVDPVDVDPGDVDPGDVDPGDIDDDVQTPGGPELGGPCDGSIQTWCNEEAVPSLSCGFVEASYVWTEYDPNGLPCYCDPASSPGPAVCAVPGFVGIDQSGRERRAPSLRSLRRAARLA